MTPHARRRQARPVATPSLSSAALAAAQRRLVFRLFSRFPSAAAGPCPGETELGEEAQSCFPGISAVALEP